MTLTLAIRLTADGSGMRGDLRLTREDLARLTGETDRSARAARDAGAATRTHSDALAGLRGVLAGLTAAYGVREILRQADAWQAVTGRLRLVTSGSDELADVQQQLLDISQRTRASLETTADTYFRLALFGQNLGRSQAELLQVTEAINAAVAITGGSAQSAEAALVQFGQAIASGTLRGEELNSVLEQAPRLALAIADGLNIPIGRLRQLGEAGQLSAQQVVDAIISQSGRLQAELAVIPTTIEQVWRAIRTALTGAIGQMDISAGLSRRLTEALQQIREVINSADFRAGAEQVLRVLADGLVDAANAALWATKNLDLVVAGLAGLVATRAISALADLGLGFQVLATTTRRAAAGVLEFGAALATLRLGAAAAMINPWVAAAVAVGVAAAAVWEYRDAVVQIGAHTTTVGDLAAATWQMTTEAAAQALQVTADWATVLYDRARPALIGIADAARVAAGFLARMVDIAVAAAATIIDAFILASEGMVRVMGAAIEGIGQGLAELADNFMRSLVPFGERPRGIEIVRQAFSGAADEAAAMGRQIAAAAAHNFEQSFTGQLSAAVAAALATASGAAESMAEVVAARAEERTRARPVANDNEPNAPPRVQRPSGNAGAAVRGGVASENAIERILAETDAVRRLAVAYGQGTAAIREALVQRQIDVQEIGRSAGQRDRLATALRDQADAQQALDLATYVRDQDLQIDAARRLTEATQAGGAAIREANIANDVASELSRRLIDVGSAEAAVIERKTRALAAQRTALEVAQGGRELALRLQDAQDRTALIGLSGEELAAQTARLGQIADWRRRNIELTEDERDRQLGIVDATARTEERTRAWSEAWSDIAAVGGKALEDLRRNTLSLGDALDAVIAIAWRMAVVRPFENALGSLTAPLGQAISQFFGFGGGSAATSAIAAAAGAVAAVHHTGGVVGAGHAPTRIVPAGLWDHAPRYHAGGLVPGERAIIARDGEEILTEDNPRHIRNVGSSSSGGVQITVIDQRGSQAAPVEVKDKGMSPSGQRQIQIYVRDAVRDLVGRGELDGALRGRYGTAPAMVRRG